jgi:hypothetical protein
LKRDHHLVVFNEITNKHQDLLCRHIHLRLQVESFRPKHFTRRTARALVT